MVEMEEIPSKDEVLEISLNPCPPGYTLRNVGGTWLCVLEGAEAISLERVRGDRALTISKKGKFTKLGFGGFQGSAPLGGDAEGDSDS